MKIKIILLSILVLSMFGCKVEPLSPSSDEVQQAQQESILKEGTSAIGMPAIKNFRERRLLKEILELRDRADVTTYTYVFNELNGKLVFFCNSIGYGIPYATQFTNPSKIENPYSAVFTTLPQADPNGLFSPPAAEGTWVMCEVPGTKKVEPQYIEPRIVVSTFELGK